MEYNDCCKSAIHRYIGKLENMLLHRHHQTIEVHNMFHSMIDDIVHSNNISIQLKPMVDMHRIHLLLDLSLHHHRHIDMFDRDILLVINVVESRHLSIDCFPIYIQCLKYMIHQMIYLIIIESIN